MKYEFADPPPFEHQVDGLRKMIETRGQAALLFDPGCGKTRVVLDYGSMLAMKQGEARILVVAPLAALDTWLDQARQWVPDHIAVWAEVPGGGIEDRGNRIGALGPANGDDPMRRAECASKADTLLRRAPGGDLPAIGHGPDALPQPRIVLAVTNHETFAYRHTARGVSSITVLDRVLDGVEAFEPDILVCDESHIIKSAHSNTSRAMARAADHAPRRVILTGTVMPHSPLDVYGQWRFLAPEAFATPLADGSVKPWSWARFRDRYARMGGYRGKEVVGFQRLDELRERMSDHALVVRKEDALDLPPTTDVTVHVHLSDQERRAYQQMKDQLGTLLSSGELATVPNRLAQIMRLRQITSGHLPVDPDPMNPTDVDERTRKIGDSKVDTARSLVHDLMQSEDRVVVFGYFRHEITAMVDAIGKALPEAEVATITGGTPKQDRIDIRKRFGKLSDDAPDKMVLVAQVGTVSLAINELVTANHAVFTSLSDRRDQYVQARDRLDRPGQDKPVTYHHLLAPGTIDEVILDSHRNRTNLESAVIDHVKGIS